MEQQVQHLTAMLDGMTRQVETQNQRVAHAEQQTGAAATEAANARSETQALHARMQSNTETMPGILTALTEAVKTQKNSGGNSGQRMIDKVTGKLIAFDEKEENFPGWRRRFENFIVGNFGETFRAALNWATESEVAVTEVMWKEEFGDDTEHELEDVKEKVNQLYAVLGHLTENDSNDIVCGAGDGNGVEGYRLLCRRWDPNQSSRKGALLKQIIAPPRCTYAELQGALERWKEQVRRYERRKDDQGVARKLDADIKLIAVEMLVPTDIENHLTLKQIPTQDI